MSGGTGFIHGSIDPRTNLLITTPSDHAYIHAEKAYSVMTTIASIAAGAYYKIGFTTPAYTSKYIHYRPSIISSSANIVRQEIYEDATFTGGDEIIPLNLDRASTNESTVVLRRGVTSSPESAAIESIVVIMEYAFSA